MRKARLVLAILSVVAAGLSGAVAAGIDTEGGRGAWIIKAPIDTEGSRGAWIK